MRTLKFRAWNRDEMEYIEDMYWFEENYYHSTDYNGGDILMQFTGLHDKNGIPIYEGDIIDILLRFYDCESFEMAVIEFRSGAFWFDAKQVGYVDCNWHHYNESDRQVIGNIYENPELLKES